MRIERYQEGSEHILCSVRASYRYPGERNKKMSLVLENRHEMKVVDMESVELMGERVASKGEEAHPTWSGNTR